MEQIGTERLFFRFDRSGKIIAIGLQFCMAGGVNERKNPPFH